MRGRLARKIEKRVIEFIHHGIGRRVNYGEDTKRRVFKALPRTLQWGKDISPENMKLLRSGRSFLLLDKHGRPYSIVLMDTFGTIREALVRR